MFEAERNYRSAVILLAKFGFTAQDIRAMCHAEVAAWIASWQISQGLKVQAEKGNTVHYNLMRRKNKGA
ncbi:hypothetical protein [Rodentibacter pneumotropicus]|uniref:hypothetical protein n=1 Tax=Rodentibacter pneumotropicus TaxID=758 RepID=UPI00109D0F37|nr:hypothetical protein [Rodentibacter pneumotropicus]NBH76184.1 hypothetical protein [Rodentibacter pneumotropicus]THA08358.1 hypothetical protein D3M73_00235 [Rodentibacter pneumotropicus]THA12580.1 hypothetical protein D3M81_05045 [Rodentibacter pneumotropicus]